MRSNIQVKKFPYLYNYKNELICELSEALNITESLRFGSLGTLTFEYPYYQIDAFGVVTKDANNKSVINPKVAFLENDFLCKYGDNWYIIKIDEDARRDDNRTTIFCTCHSIGYELQEKMVEYLNLTPPLSNSVDVTTALSEVLIACQQVRDNKIVSATANTAVLDANAFPVDDYYNGFKIKILSGTGSGQIRTISDYVASSKTVTISVNWTTNPDSTSVYRIYNDIWSVGTIDSSFTGILRSHKFDFTNGLDALQQAKDKYVNSSGDTGYLTYTASFNGTTGRWEKKVNLVKPNSFSGVEFRYRKNIKSVTRQKYTNEIYTKIIPSGVNNLGVNEIATSNRTDSSVTYPEHVLGSNSIENFQYFLALGYTYKQCVDNFSKVYRFEDTRYTVALDLYNDCKKLLEKLSMPKIVYETTILDLSVLTGMSYESFKIGDTIRVYDDELGFDVYATISALEVNQETPQNAGVELTNFLDNFSDIIQKLVNRGDGYTDQQSKYGNTATYIIADYNTTTNWRKADYVVQPFEYINDVINKVITSIDTTKGARIILLEGTYNLSGSINIKSNISIEGQGSPTKIVGTNAVSIGILSQGTALNRLNNISIKNINIYGCDNNVSINYTDRILIEGVLSPYCGNNHIIIQNSSEIICANSTISSQIYVDGNDGIDIKTSVNISIYNNTIYHNAFRGINLESADGSIDIYSNYIICESGGLHGLVVYGLGGVSGWENSYPTRNVNIYNNTITSYATGTPNVFIQGFKGINFHDNKIYGGYDAVQLYEFVYVNVLNNQLYNYEYAGIRTQGTTSFYVGRATMHGNILNSVGAVNGIVISTNVDSCMVVNNDLKYSCLIPSVNGISNSGTNTLLTSQNRVS